jgi:hypothetical protein
MAATTASPTNALRSVLKDLGWSQTHLIAELRREAARQGIVLPKTESLVALISRWMNNHQQPADFYRDLLSRTIGRPRAALFGDDSPVSLATGAHLELVQPTAVGVGASRRLPCPWPWTPPRCLVGCERGASAGP